MKCAKEKFSVKNIFPDSDNPFSNNILPSCGFAFKVENTLLCDFNDRIILESSKKDVHGIREINSVKWADTQTGIEMELFYVYFTDTGVMEIEGKVFNCGNKIIKNISAPFSLSLAIDITKTGTPRMTTVYGGASTQDCFPPPSYLVTQTNGLRSLIGGREGGRSTETEMPYAILTDQDENYGMFYSLEWPGRWIFCAGENMEDGRKVMRILAHVAYTSFDLKPGKSMCIPKANLGFFKGNALAGSNALRKHIVKNVRRPIKETSALPPVFYNHYYGFGDDSTFNEKNLKKEAKVYAELGIEYFVVDAGWFKGGFRSGIGNWEIEEDKVFPNGMAAFADYVRSLGMKFGSWLEPEFAMKDSDWVKRHPDWFYYADDKHDYFYGRKDHIDCLLKLDKKEVRMKVADFLEKWVNKYGIEWLRWDFNNAPAPFWEANESQSQWGIIQLEYGEGLYALLDEFMARCPQVHLEACAGGGHRMDMGTLRRAHSAWINDNSNNYHAIRRFQSGLNRVQPGNYANSAFIWMTHERQREQSLNSFRKNGYPPAVLRSRMAGSLCFSEQVSYFTPSVKKYLKKEIANYKAQRHLLMKEYYPLLNPQSLDECDGWQFHDPDTGEGFFQVFRCASAQKEIDLSLRGLDVSTRYIIKDVDRNEDSIISGEDKFKIRFQKKNDAKWFTYKELQKTPF